MNKWLLGALWVTPLLVSVYAIADVTTATPLPVVDAALGAKIDNLANAPVPFGGFRIGYTSDDPCSNAVKTNAPISQVTGTKLISGIPTKKIYICSAFTIGADAESESVVEGTGTTCGTGTAAVIGGITAAAGPNFLAGGGFAHGGGVGTIASTSTAGTDLCLFQSGSGRVAGNLTVVIQ